MFTPEWRILEYLDLLRTYQVSGLVEAVMREFEVSKMYAKYIVEKWRK